MCVVYYQEQFVLVVLVVVCEHTETLIQPLVVVFSLAVCLQVPSS